MSENNREREGHSRLRRSAPLVVSAIALTLAAGGIGVGARALITGADIKNGSITGADIKSGSIAGDDIKPGSIQVSDLSKGALNGLDGKDGKLVIKRRSGRAFDRMVDLGQLGQRDNAGRWVGRKREYQRAACPAFEDIAVHTKRDRNTIAAETRVGICYAERIGPSRCPGTICAIRRARNRERSTKVSSGDRRVRQVTDSLCILRSQQYRVGVHNRCINSRRIILERQRIGDVRRSTGGIAITIGRCCRQRNEVRCRQGR
jgi:hypothetical protein